MNLKILDEWLIAERNSDDLPQKTKEEVDEYLQTHDINVFSDESCELLSGIFSLNDIGGLYELKTGQRIPNIFKRL